MGLLSEKHAVVRSVTAERKNKSKSRESNTES